MTRHKGLGELLRKNMRRRRLPEVKHAIQLATGLGEDQTSYLELSESDCLQSPCAELIQRGLADEGLHRCYQLKTQKDVEAKLKVILESWKDADKMNVFLQSSDTLGALRVDAKTFVRAAFALLPIDQDCIYACSCSENKAILLDRSVEHGRETFEICLVGFG